MCTTGTVQHKAEAPSDRERYLRCGAHCVLGKELRMGEMVEQIAEAYVILQQHSQRPPSVLPLKRLLADRRNESVSSTGSEAKVEEKSSSVTCHRRLSL